MAGSLINLGNVAFNLQQLDEARAFFERARELERQLGNPAGEGRTLINLGNVATRQGDDRRSRELYEEALGRFEAVGHKGGLLYAHNGIAYVSVRAGDWVRARRHCAACLRLCRELSDRKLTAGSLTTAAVIACRLDRPQDAAILLGASWAAYERVGALRSPQEEAEVAELEAALRREMGDEAAALAVEEGGALEWEESTSRALEVVGT